LEEEQERGKLKNKGKDNGEKRKSFANLFKKNTSNNVTPKEQRKDAQNLGRGKKTAKKKSATLGIKGGETFPGPPDIERGVRILNEET